MKKVEDYVSGQTKFMLEIEDTRKMLEIVTGSIQYLNVLADTIPHNQSLLDHITRLAKVQSALIKVSTDYKGI